MGETAAAELMFRMIRSASTRDRRIEPREPRVVLLRALAPLRIELLQHVVQQNRLADVHEHVPELLAQLGHGAEQPEDALLLLRLAGKLADIRRAFDHALVAEVHRQKRHRPLRMAQEAAHRHRDHPGLRLQQATGAAATTLDEVLDGMPAPHDGGEIVREDDGVERVALEAAPNEERAALAQESSDERQIQVDARRDVRIA